MSDLLFLDIETTGLDPEKEGILEIYCQPCDSHSLKELCPPFHRYVEATPAQLDGMNPFVLEMHLDTGLLGEQGEPLAEVVEDLSKYLKQFPKGILVGRNVGTFDRRFLEEKGVDLSGLHYHNRDISTILAIFATWRSEEHPFEVPEFEGTKHRADVDVKNDIEIMRAVADYLEGVE